jgi:hypothetical protein
MWSGVNTTSTIRWSPCVLVVLLQLAGCTGSQGLSLHALEDEISRAESRFFDARPTGVAPARPDAPKLGLYLKPTGFLHREFEWTSRDRDAVLAWSQGISLGRGRSTGFLTLSSVRGQTFTELRAIAARYGVDWVLVFDGAAAVDRYNNYKAALLYWTIVGAYLADGTHSDALCLVRATLWDVKTGVRLLEEQAKAESKTVGPAALVDDLEQIEKARMAALDLLFERLAGRIGALARTDS